VLDSEVFTSVVSGVEELEEVVEDCFEHPNKNAKGKAKKSAVLKYLFILYSFHHNTLLNFTID